jgi:hypothetical protein
MRAVSGTEWHTIEHHLGEIARELDDPDALAPLLTRTSSLYAKSELEMAPFEQMMRRAQELTLQNAVAAEVAGPGALGYWFSTLESLITR